jgi:hypothetical protein
VILNNDKEGPPPPWGLGDRQGGGECFGVCVNLLAIHGNAGGSIRSVQQHGHFTQKSIMRLAPATEQSADPVLTRKDTADADPD